MFQKLVQITAHFAGVKSHDSTIDAFRDLVTHEASMFATADWARRHPEIYSLVAEYLVFHTALISRAHAYVFHLHATGFHEVPDPLDDAQREISTMHSLGLVSGVELVWHLAKLDQEQTEVARERNLLRERLVPSPQLGKCRPICAAE